MLIRMMLVIGVLSYTASAWAYEGRERVVWKKKPIPVVLKVGEERIIHFPADIEHWEPEIVQHIVVAEAVADTLYIKATNNFPTVRFRVRERESSKVYLLDVTALKQTKVADTLIVIDGDRLSGESEKASKSMARIEEDWRVRLTRAASQDLYAPSRIVASDFSIRRVPLDAGVEVPLIRGGKVLAQTVASWAGGGWYVHAVKLKNKTNEPVTLDPRNSYRGNWSTVTLQHSSLGPVVHLGPTHTQEHTTTAYLTSKRSFHESLSWGLSLGAPQ